jgi:hypothetical protein
VAVSDSVLMEWRHNEGDALPADPPPGLVDWEDACREVGVVWAVFVVASLGLWHIARAEGADLAVNTGPGPWPVSSPSDLTRELRRVLLRRGLPVEPA